MRNATAETEAHPGPFTSGSAAFPTAPGLAPKWRVDALPNWLRRPTTTTTTVIETSREEWAEWRGGEGCACKRPNYIKSCINHEPRPCFCCCALFLLAACCLAKTNLAAILCFKCRIVLPLLLLPSPAPLCATTSLRYFRSAAANEFLFASDSSGVKSSCVHEFFSCLSPAMRLRAHVLIRFHSPIIT